MSEADHVLKQLCHRVRSAGLRVTAARRAVLRLLINAEGPVSHRQLSDELVKLGIDTATVYRNLISLTKIGMLNRYELGDHVWRFEIKAAGEADHSSHDDYHPHLICTECGDVVCLPTLSTEFVGALRQIELGLGAIDEVILKGTCQKCLGVSTDANYPGDSKPESRGSGSHHPVKTKNL